MKLKKAKIHDSMTENVMFQDDCGQVGMDLQRY